MKRLFKLYVAFFRANLIRFFTYRGNFWFNFLLTALESVLLYIGVAILFTHITSIAGWSYQDMLVLIGVFMICNTLSWLLFRAGVNDLDMIINKGDLDWYLIKPADTQLLITFQRIDIQDSGRAVVGILAIIVGLQGSSVFSAIINLPAFFVTILMGQLVLYSISLAIKTVSFKSIQGWATAAISWRFFELAHYPTDIYFGVMRMIYTFVFPLVFVATVPAKALQGDLPLHLFLGSIVAALCALMITRLIWKRALGSYSSASS